MPDEASPGRPSSRSRCAGALRSSRPSSGPAEFGKVDLSYRVGDRPERVVYCDESVRHRLRAGERAGPRGQASGRQPSASGARPSRGEVVRRSQGSGVRRRRRRSTGASRSSSVLGAGGFSKVYRVRDEVEGEERALQAVRQCRRLRRSAAGDRRAPQDPPPERRRGVSGLERPAGRVVPHHRVHRRRAARRVCQWASGICATERRSTSPSTSSTLWSRSTPTAVRLEELDRRSGTAS